MTSVVLAKALYNNDSEADDELSFKKGDVITVLETDFEGMTGWWLCSLGDRQGVAPGNRLQLISFGGDVETGDSEDVYDTPGKAHKERYGDVDYDVPQSHRSALEYQDYAIPKAPFNNIPAPESQRHGFILPSPRKVSELRNSNSSDGLVTNERWSSERSSDEFRFSGEVYHESGPEEMYDVPSRNSMGSDDSGMGGTGTISLSVPVIPPKTRGAKNGYQSNNSGLQEPQEIYDTPATIVQDATNGQPACSDDGTDVYDELPAANCDSRKVNVLLKSLSGNSELYDTLPSEIYDVPPAGPEEIYDVPATESVTLPADGNNNPPSSVSCDEVTKRDTPAGDDTIYDIPPEKSFPGGVYDNFDLNELENELRMEEERLAEMVNNVQDNGPSLDASKKTKAKKQNSEDDYVDYQEIYGMGEDEQEDSKEGGKRKSEHSSVLDRIHMDKVRELAISRAVAMENLDKLQQAVDVAVTKLMSFVTDDWRRSEVYALNINGIRDISGKVKVALRLLTEFGLGALVNSQKLPDGAEVSRKIKEALEPLLQTYYSIKSAIQQLDETNWRSAYQAHDDDELNSIARMAQGIPCDAYNLGAVIANVSTIVFSKTAGQSNSEPAAVNLETNTPFRNSTSTPSPVTVQKETMKGVEPKKFESEPVGMRAKQLLSPTKAPPPTAPKPRKDPNEKKKDSGPDHQQSLSDNVSELTNNLLNQLEDMKKASPVLRRKGSKKLSPKTVRRLCSLGLKNDDKISEKILEDVSSVPPKPLRQSSSPVSEEDASVRTSVDLDSRRLSGTMSDPGPAKSSQINNLNHENANQMNFQRLNSFVEKMDSQFVILKEGIKSFGESVRERQKPKVFVAHSKFIVLSAHKLVYIGDGASRGITNVSVKSVIASVTNSLSEVINDFVENIKIAARQYPEDTAMNVMIRSASKVTEKALELYKVIKDHAES